MRFTRRRARLLTMGGMVLAGVVLVADGLRFSDFTPLATSAGPTADESLPMTLGNWDMLTVNETGRQRGRYLFTVFETGSSGV